MSRYSMILIAVITKGLIGCAVVAGSPAWFETKRPDVEAMAQTALNCSEGPIEFVPAMMNDYRHVKASGCGSTAEYKWVKVGPVGKWAGPSE